MRIFQETSNEAELLKLQGKLNDKLNRLDIVDGVAAFVLGGLGIILVGCLIFDDVLSLFISAGKEQSGAFGIVWHLAFLVFSWIPLGVYYRLSEKKRDKLEDSISRLQPSSDYKLESEPERGLEASLIQSLESAYSAKSHFSSRQYDLKQKSQSY